MELFVHVNYEWALTGPDQSVDKLDTGVDHKRLTRFWNRMHGRCDFYFGWLVESVDIDWSDSSLLGSVKRSVSLVSNQQGIMRG